MPEWAPRIAPGKIKRLYELDARGIRDDELIDEIGWALKARCESFIQAVQATRGEATCPGCRTIIYHQMRSEDLLTCSSCGWHATWKDYFSTIQHKQLSGADAVLSLFGEYVTRFPHACTPGEKMFQIDRLLHGFHYYGKTTTRPVAVNLLDGRLGEVIAFLDELSYGSGSTPGLSENFQDWEEKSKNSRNWDKRERK